MVARTKTIPALIASLSPNEYIHSDAKSLPAALITKMKPEKPKKQSPNAAKRVVVFTA